MSRRRPPKPPPHPKSLFVTVRVRGGRREVYDAWPTEESARNFSRMKPWLHLGVGVTYVGEYVRKEDK